MINEPDPTRAVIGFWREGDTVRGWTPQSTGTLPLEPLASTLKGPPPTLLDPEGRWLLATTLAPEVVQMLTEGLAHSAEPGALHLSTHLPLRWQKIPFEALTHKGQRLGDRLQVIRHAAPLATPPVFPHTPHGVLIDLWPKEERGTSDGQMLFAGLGALLDKPILLRGHRCAEADLPQRDLSHKALLVVISHGSEDRDAQPLRTETGEGWALPLTQGMPPVVVLLACGDVHGNLLDYGQTLLAAGAQTVLAPVGRLDAPAADRFLRTFLPGWNAGRTVADLLWAAQQLPDSAYGAGRLRLLGRGDLHRGPARTWAEQSDPVLNTAAPTDDAALQALLERITVRCLQRYGTLDTVVDELYDALGMQYDDAPAETALLPRLDRLREDLPPLTADWVTPYIVYLAEPYDHGLLSRYRSLGIDLQPDSPHAPDAPFIYHAWGKRHYRNGHYVEALEHLAHGLARLDEARLRQAGGIGLLGLLVNCLIDLDLPEPGLVLYDRLDAGLARAKDQLSQLQRTNRLDRRARLALRQGCPEQALIHYQQKHAEDHRDPDRERAGLLYAAAWADPRGSARALAAAVSKTLQAHTPLLSQLGPGNATLAYLIRAYALWAWRARDPAALTGLAAALTSVHEHLPGRDTGPLGFALGYLHLYQAATGDTTVALPSWAIAEGALEAWHYWFELAVFSALLGRRPQAERFLYRFHALRAEALPVLEQLPSWLAVGPPIAWRAALDRRRDEERRLLLAESPPKVEALIQAGVLPL